MKRIGIVLSILSLTFALHAQDAKPIISFEKKIHDFGPIQENKGAVSYTFQFTNTGKQPLVIHNVNASCGCTTPDWTRTPIQPGGKGTVKATFDPRNRPGNFNKSITITSNASNATEILRITGNVAPHEQTMEDIYPSDLGLIRAKSSHLPFTRVEPNSKKEASLEFINVSDKAVTLSFTRVPPHISISSVPATVAPGKEGNIVAVFDASKLDDWGFVSNQVYLSINGEEVKDKRLSLSATIEEDYSSLTPAQLAAAPDIQFSETNFDFGNVKQGITVEHIFKVTNKGKSDLILRKVRSSCGCTVSKPEKDVIKPGETVNIPVTFNTRGRNGRQNQSVTVYSNDPQKSTSLLRISATVAP